MSDFSILNPELCITICLLIGASCWVIRAGMFCLVGDASLTLAVASMALVGWQGHGQLVGTGTAVLCCMAILSVFFLLTQILKLDDVLISIAMNMVIIGLTEVWVLNSVGMRYIDGAESQNAFVTYNSIGFGTLLVVLTLYLLRFSNLRNQIAAASEPAKFISIFSGNLIILRFIACLIFGIMTAAAGVLTSLRLHFSVDLWQEGLGLLSFAIAYAASARIIFALFLGVGLWIVRVVGVNMAAEGESARLGPYLIYIYTLTVLVMTRAWPLCMQAILQIRSSEAPQDKSFGNSPLEDPTGSNTERASR